MRPRAYNILSYSLALVVFIALALLCSSSWPRAHASPELGAVLGALFWAAHFTRRTLESAFVHRYSGRSVPASAFIPEYVYYWGFAAWNAVTLFSPGYRSPPRLSLILGVVLFVVAELGNAKAHRMLRDLRMPHTAERKLPRGFLFERVSCPHYLFEILSWVGFTLVTGTLAALAFTVLGAAILAAWSRSRHLAYKKEFDGREGRELYPIERRALVPYMF